MAVPRPRSRGMIVLVDGGTASAVQIAEGVRHLMMQGRSLSIFCTLLAFVALSTVCIYVLLPDLSCSCVFMTMIEQPANISQPCVTMDVFAVTCQSGSISVKMRILRYHCQLVDCDKIMEGSLSFLGLLHLMEAYPSRTWLSGKKHGVWVYVQDL